MTDRSMATAIFAGGKGIDDRIAGHWASPASTAGAKDICLQYVDNKKKNNNNERIPVNNVPRD